MLPSFVLNRSHRFNHIHTYDIHVLILERVSSAIPVAMLMSMYYPSSS